jgi:hypothetical protein
MAPVLVPPASPAQDAPDVVRIGTFDSRAVALAYYRSPGVLDEMMGGMKAARDEAMAAGDTAKVDELELKAASMQHLMHQQVFSTGSICNLYPGIDDELSRVAQEAGAVALVSKWELPYTMPGLEVVDLTREVVALFAPEEAIEEMVAGLLAQDPVPLEDLLYDPED